MNDQIAMSVSHPGIDEWMLAFQRSRKKGEYDFHHRGGLVVGELVEERIIVTETNRDEQAHITRLAFPSNGAAMAFYLANSDVVDHVVGL